MRYAFVAAVLVGAVAASPAWSPPAYGGQDEGSWGSSAPAEGQTTVVTVTSCAATVTDCPAGSPSAPGYPATTPATEAPPAAETPYSPEESSPVESAPPAGETPYSPEQPPVYGGETPSASAPPAGETPYSPEQPPVYGGESSAPAPSAPVESAPPAGETPYSPEQPPASAPVESAPPAGETPYSPVGGEAPPAYGTGLPSYPAGNGTWGPNPTASGAPSASQNYPVQQTGNTASGLKAGSFLAGCGAIAALLL